MHLSQVKQEMQQVWCDGWSRVEAQTGNPHWFTSVVAHRSVKPLSAQASTIDIESCVGTRGMTATSHLHDELQYCPCLRLPGKEAKNVLQKDEPPCQRGSVRVGGAGVNTMKKADCWPLLRWALLWVPQFVIHPEGVTNHWWSLPVHP